MKGKTRTIYYRFVEQLLKALKIAHVRRFPQKHDPRKYGVWAHAILLALKELEEKLNPPPRYDPLPNPYDPSGKTVIM